MSSTYTYPTISTVTVSTKSKGHSGTATLKSIFSTTPELSTTSANYKEIALALLLDGTVEENPQVGTFSKDYSDAPNYADVKTGGEGLPASAWVPNPASPGEGSVSPADQVAAPDGFGVTPTNGSHAGSSTVITAEGRNPSITSTNMSERVSTPTPGQSPATQNAS